MYVLITAARNEEAYIKETIRSVVSQSLRPKKWVIVSDGSVDRTEEIIIDYAAKNDFMQFVRVRPNANRNFASKANAIKIGSKQLEDIEYEFFGNLDADVSFEPNYFEGILRKFEQNQKLGIAGGVIFEKIDGKYIRGFSSTWSVSGAIQLFNRQCYEDIGGYIPLDRGGMDEAAEVMARMHGWQVQSFDDYKVLHYRRSGTRNKHILISRFQKGLTEYSLGYHPVFEVAKCFFRIKEHPYLIGSVFRIGGYFWGFLNKLQVSLPNIIIKNLRDQQIQRLHSFFSSNI